MFEYIKKWWQGKYINPPQSNQNDSIVFISGYFERHWSSKIVHKLVDFYLEHWKFIWGSIIAIFCASIKFF